MDMSREDAKDILENMLRFKKLNHLTAQEQKAIQIAIAELDVTITNQ
jgi:hypothetical protein